MQYQDTELEARAPASLQYQDVGFEARVSAPFQCQDTELEARVSNTKFEARVRHHINEETQSWKIAFQHHRDAQNAELKTRA